MTAVVITRDRRDSTLAALGQLRGLPEQPPVVLVDNASTDGTADAVNQRYPEVQVVRLPRNHGAAARTVGVRRATTPYVAFSDDDSWWAVGAVDRAADVLERVPDLAVVAGRVLVGAEQRLDAVCEQMRDSPLPPVPGAGPRLLGFVACGAVVRRDAYLQVGGFHPRLVLGGEETLLAVDLAEAGWACAYLDDVVAHHHPSPVRDVNGRRTLEVRNRLWTSWLRHRPGVVVAETAAVVRRLPTDAAARHGLMSAVAGLPWVVRERRAVSPATQRAWACVESAR